MGMARIEGGLIRSPQCTVRTASPPKLVSSTRDRRIMGRPFADGESANRATNGSQPMSDPSRSSL